MFGIFKKKKLHKRILVLNAIPYTEVEFKNLCMYGTSDFVKSLNSDKAKSPDDIWKRYEATARQIGSTLSKLSKWGVEIINNFSLSDLAQITNFDIAIIIAHHSDNSDEIELGSRLVSTRLFIDAFPRDMVGTVDFTSCYSSYLLPPLKLKNPQCKFIGIDVATTLPFRLFLMEEVIKSMRDNNKIEYKEALILTLRRVSKAFPAEDYESHITYSENVRLGGSQLKSTVFAPASAPKGQDFMVQVFLHNEKDSDEVLLTAQMIDDNTSVRNSKTLSFKVVKGDKIEFQLMQVPNASGDFEIEDEIKGFIYEESPSSVEFCVSVLSSCKKDAFIGKIKIAVNKLPVGDMLFKTAITAAHDDESQICADFVFNRFDTSRESENANQWLLDRITNVKQRLLSNISGQTKESRVELEICDKCMELLSSNDYHESPILKVFISSTSDMKKYRLVIKEQVTSCEMYADMYELWGQGNYYPRDMCCKHVINSDIFVLILGSSYGFVEPFWEMSMTEIEYRVAERCGIPILIYIDTNWQKGIDDDKNAVLSKKQEALITELSSNRLVHFFQNENKLAMQCIAELLTLKNRMIYGSNKRPI